MKVFCDTNVLLDVLARREPFYASSAAVWTLAETGRIEAFVSVISYPNVYYIMRRLGDRRAAKKALMALRDLFQPVALDEAVLNRAIDAGFRDFEDAVQLFSALRAGADCLLTRNPRHYPTADIPVQTPREFLAILSMK